MTISGEHTTTTERRHVMLTEQTIEKLYAMKLNGMADAFKEQLQQPDMLSLIHI